MKTMAVPALFALGLLWAPCVMAQTKAPRKSPDPRYAIGAVEYADDFNHGLSNWFTELQRGGSVTARDGQLDINVPAGCTVWFKPLLHGPLMIEYQATVISAGGPNDRVSDLNCFWMARDSRSPDDLFATHRDGKFSDYDRLATYYVGLGGNTNTTTRFRRYLGRQDNRPLLPQNDLRDPADLLAANQTQTIRLVADGKLIQYWRNEKKLFEMIDPHPYTSGWFGLRTTINHMRVRQFRVYALKPLADESPTTQPEN
jgi:Domain of unknown function (DUF6250)